MWKFQMEINNKYISTEAFQNFSELSVLMKSTLMKSSEKLLC